MTKHSAETGRRAPQVKLAYVLQQHISGSSPLVSKHRRQGKHKRAPGLGLRAVYNRIRLTCVSSFV